MICTPYDTWFSNNLSNRMYCLPCSKGLDDGIFLCSLVLIDACSWKKCRPGIGVKVCFFLGPTLCGSLKPTRMKKGGILTEELQCIRKRDFVLHPVVQRCMAHEQTLLMYGTSFPSYGSHEGEAM